MKPINLKIKGLNSFIEVQEINFQRLTEKGLFGIFGPTGSGKSTILDGITLALYGEVSRKSTNYMNTNCDSMFVSYEFQMTDKEVKRYRVDREFRRDSKTSNVRTKSAIIVDLTEGEKVLEDKVRDVTAKCQEIIGLRLDDFTRTVILPQGQFSEFLKLEGKERREMLERLFNLQRYGDELSIKLGMKIKEENQKFNILEGELNIYEDISDEFYRQKNEDLKQINENLEICRNELKSAEKSFNEAKELWGLQKELSEVKRKESYLKEKEEEIKLDKKRVASGESALKVKPYVDNYESTMKHISTVKSEIDKLKAKLEIVKENKKQAEEDFKLGKEKKDIELPKLKIKEQHIIEAIEEKKLLNKLTDEKNTLNKHITKIDERLKTIYGNIEISEKDLVNLKESINSREIKIESLRISEEFKNKVNDGFILLNECESISKQKGKVKTDIERAVGTIKEASNKSEILSKALKEKEEELLEVSKKLNHLSENSPGDQDTLLKLNENLIYIKDKWSKYKEYTAAIEKSGLNIEVLAKELKNKEQAKKQVSEDLKLLNEKIKKYQIENIAHTLRGNLEQGEICPVCGSKDHDKENIAPVEISDSLQTLGSEQVTMEEKHRAITAEIIKIQERLKSEEDSIRDNNLRISKLGEDYKEYSVEELKIQFDTKYSDFNKYNQEKTALDKKMKILTEEKNNLLLNYNKLNSDLSHSKNQLKNLQEDLDAKNKDLQEADNKLSILKKEISIEDFIAARKEINRKEKERALLEKDIKALRESLLKEEEHKEKLSKEHNELIIELKENKTIIAEKTKAIAEKETIIINKAGHVENLVCFKDEITKEINNIEIQFQAAEKKKNETEEEFNGINNKIISYQGNYVSLQERIIEDKDMLNKALTEEGIATIHEVKNNFIPKIEIERLKSKIENYNNSLSEINGALVNLNRKINKRNLTEEDWKKIQEDKNEKSASLEDLQKTSTGMEVELKSIKEKLAVKNKILKEKSKLEHKMALLNDLDKLFRGKKFVEFVATNQLKYVSIEASKRLKEISGGTYGLEVDENGKFLIRDYKNGGAQRDASTLSGGETFIASLALALALSSQIQLKGTSPLELFFLDEGFGTLDDNLLDIVMESLEKIHNDRLSVGIISHVDSIKNRVPIKLIVSPAEAGLGGSKVKIEVS